MGEEIKENEKKSRMYTSIVVQIETMIFQNRDIRMLGFRTLLKQLSCMDSTGGGMC